MIKYPKIETVFKRDPETKFKTLIEGEFATPELELLKGITWEFTEKVDGTNIRVNWDVYTNRIQIEGRKDNSEVPMFLHDHIMSSLSGRFNSVGHPSNLTLFGEGYGARIQKGGDKYIPDGVGFILFDVYFDNRLWLDRKSVVDIAKKLGIPSVPVVGTGTLKDFVVYGKVGFPSEVAKMPKMAEGLVGRPCGLVLLDRMGEPIMTKIKYQDFPA